MSSSPIINEENAFNILTIVIIDKDGNRIPHVKSFNTATQEAVLMKVENRRVQYDENHIPILETKILEGAHLEFIFKKETGSQITDYPV